MAGTDTKKQFLSLIRDFALEKSQGERRVVGLKKRIGELRSELEAANSELEEAKRFNETTEQELKGYEVELALNDTAIHTLEARISLIQDAISTVGSEVDVLKSEEGAARDGFIRQMIELNATIRTFQQTTACNFEKESNGGTIADCKYIKKEVPEDKIRTLEVKLADLVSQTAKEEEDYLEQENMQKKVQQELIDLERKGALMEAIMKGTIELQNLTQQTSELEQECACLSEELQKRCVCPSCNSENIGELSGILQTN